MFKDKDKPRAPCSLKKVIFQQYCPVIIISPFKVRPVNR